LSLPTQAWYYDKDNVVIHKEFVNVGWYLTWDNWLETINNLPTIENAVFIKVYCVKFPVSWIGTKTAYLHELYYDRNHNAKDIDGWRYFREVYGAYWYKKSDLKLDTRWSDVRSRLKLPDPVSLAEDIVNVQPITASTGKIFTFNPKYGNDNE
jgi:hypothetical protein